MNSKNVLNRILTLLSLDEVNFTDAKSANGDILQSPTFDLGEDVEVVHEDGTKTPAPDGEYTISLKDESGNENIIRIEVKDGKIVERANEEEEKNEEGETEDDKKPEMEMSDEKKGALETDEAHALPNTTDEDPRNRVGPDTDDQKDPIISLSYRIDELEKMVKDLHTKMSGEESPVDEEAVSEEAPEAEGEEVAMSKAEEELPKLDGAPIDSIAKLSSNEVHKPNYGKKIDNSQSTFLSKLYR
jgi:hypothetical protein